MAESEFPFLRATFYRWVQQFPVACPDLAGAPTVLAVGDLHVENFGTWRDVEARLVWGINDFDEAAEMPYTIDLVRLATSALLAIQQEELKLDPDDACDSLLAGYSDSLKAGGAPFVLAEQHPALRHMAAARLRDPVAFWQKLEKLPELKSVPPDVAAILDKWLPEQALKCRYAHRIAGLGSLGRRRFTALAAWRGGYVVREAKELAPSAYGWEKNGSEEVHYGAILRQAVRDPDPFVQHVDSWIVRRLGPDCCRIELSGLPAERDELKLLRHMGFETANIHCGQQKSIPAIQKDLAVRGAKWLRTAAHAMAKATYQDWTEWKKHYPTR